MDDQLEADIARAEKRTIQSEMAWLLRQLRDGSAAADAAVAALVQEWLRIPGWDHDAQLRLLAKCHEAPAKLRLAAIKAAQPQSNGVYENVDEIHALAFNSAQIDAFARLLAPGEYYLPGQSTPRGLRTSLRIYPRSEITAACRESSQMNDALFAKGFPGESEIRVAEERLAEANKPPISPGSRGMVSNSDWRR
mgnify:CR=1 FL=1